jgi:hypothetical protein
VSNPRPVAPVTDRERWSLLAAIPLLALGLLLLWLMDWWWATLPASALLFGAMCVRAVKAWRVGDWENTAMGAHAALLCVLAVAGTATNNFAVWCVLAAVALVGVIALAYQTRRDFKQFEEWRKRTLPELPD